MEKIKHIILGLAISFLLVSSVFAKDVALVVKDIDDISYSHEKKVKHVLEEMGLTVYLIDENSNPNYSDYDLIVVAGRPGNVYSYEHFGDFAADIPVSDYPTVVIGSTYLDDWGWMVPGGLSTASSTRPHEIKVIDGSNPIT